MPFLASILHNINKTPRLEALMNIRTKQIDTILLQQDIQAKKSSVQKSDETQGFAGTLAKQSSVEGTESNIQNSIPVSPVQTSVVQQMLVSDAENFAATNASANATHPALEQASGTLDLWESYAQILRVPEDGESLRDAYALLEGIETQVSTLKKDNKLSLEQNPDLASLVNELEVMSTTEKIKFNRGDYM